MGHRCPASRDVFEVEISPRTRIEDHMIDRDESRSETSMPHLVATLSTANERYVTPGILELQSFWRAVVCLPRHPPSPVVAAQCGTTPRRGRRPPSPSHSQSNSVVCSLEERGGSDVS